MTTGGPPALGARPAPPPPRKAPDNHGQDGSRRTQILVAVIGAVATITAGALAVNSGAVHVSLADPQAEADELRTTVASLERSNDDLQSRNEQLRQEVEALSNDAVETFSGTTTGVTSSTEAPTSSVRRQTGDTPLTFTWAYSVDLDSIDADWSVAHGSDSGWDLYLDGFGKLKTRGEVVLFDHVPTEAECRDATVRQTGLESSQSVVDAMMCVTTSEDRHAFVRLAAVDEQRRTASVDILVWE